MPVAPRGIGFYLPLGLISAAGAVLLLVVTRWGIGLSPDSAVYISGARGLMLGQGYSVPVGGGDWEQITLWPPFYSVMLAGVGVLGLDPLEGARWLNSILFGLTAFLVGLSLKEATGTSRAVPLMGALLFLVIDDSLSAFGWAWSDGLALLLGFAGLLLTLRYLKTRQPSACWAAAGLIAMSLLTRYAAVAFLLTAVAAIAVASRRDGARGTKVRGLAAIVGASCVLMGIWLLRNAQVSGSLLGPRVFAGPIAARDWEAMYNIISLWLVPGRIPSSLRALLMVLVGATFLVLSSVAIVARPQSGRDRGAGNPLVAQMALIFIPIYLLVLLGTRSALRHFNMAEDRYYLPVYLALVIVFLVDSRWLYGRAERLLSSSRIIVGPTWARLILGAGVGLAFGFVLLFHGVQAWKWARESYTEGMGYANESWHRSQLVGYLQSLAADVPIFSNGYDALYVLSGREVYPIPEASARPGQEGFLEDQWSEMEALMRERGGVALIFREATRRGMVSEETLLDRLPLCPLFYAGEGKAYLWCGEGTGQGG